MIRYYCDLCKGPINAEGEFRYVVKMEIVAAFSSRDDDSRKMQDLLAEVDEIVTEFDDDERPLVERELHQELRFDLCEDCRRMFLNDPLGGARERRAKFSTN